MAAEQNIYSDFNIALSNVKKTVDMVLGRLLAEQKEIEPRLMEAMRYMLEGPGKRVRSAVLLWSCQAVSGSINSEAEYTAAAVEIVHTYSLIHDDLPAIDNDDLRRGKPTCHKQFDEATAILTGDALLTLAFEVLSHYVQEPLKANALVEELSKAAGAAGMIAGQMVDLKSEGEKGTKELVENIHTNKTAKMFSAAAAMGAICGNSDKEQYETLGRYGLKIGLCFQITDDILDVSSSSEQLGKTAGKDQKAKKVTYPAVVGLEKSKEIARDLAQKAMAEIEPFGQKAALLRQLAIELLNRKK